MNFDPRAVEKAITGGLPDRARWLINVTPLDFDFSIGRRGICPLSVLDNVTRSGLWVFGVQDFAEGGGARPWLCVSDLDGSVCGIDPEQDQPLIPLNSSVAHFIATFLFLDRYLARNEPLPSNCGDYIREIDPEGYPRSDWRLLIDELNAA